MVTTAMILAAGLGTRLLPLTKALPKEMLPVVDKPLIQYAVEEAVASGIERIVLVTARGKGAMEDYFDYAPGLERFLGERGDKAALSEVRRIADMASITYLRQKEQLGIGHAVLSARHAIGDQPFVLIFPDDIIDHPTPATQQMLEVHRRFGGSVVAVERVPREDIPRYGIVAGESVAEGVYRLTGLVEKPRVEDAPSDLGIVGRYILSPTIFRILEETPPGVNGEVQITDAMQRLIAHEPLYAYQFQGARYDTGNILGLLKASVSLALKHPSLGEPLREYLRELEK